MFRRLLDVFECRYWRVYNLSVVIECYKLMEMVTEVKWMFDFIPYVGRLIVTYETC